jgi:hypothetical protein
MSAASCTVEDLRMAPPIGRKPRDGESWPTHRARARARRRIRQTPRDGED